MRYKRVKFKKQGNRLLRDDPKSMDTDVLEMIIRAECYNADLDIDYLIDVLDELALREQSHADIR